VAFCSFPYGKITYKVFAFGKTTGGACVKINHHPVKGILHPNMKIMSSFPHPQVVANQYDFLSSDEHKGRYFEEWLELWHPFFFFFYYRSQWGQTTVWFQSFQSMEYPFKLNLVPAQWFKLILTDSVPYSQCPQEHNSSHGEW